MTKEELIDFCEMKSQLEPENEDIFNYIIEALEQEPVLDKIRAEIKQLPDMDETGVFSSVRMKSMVLDILDKYKKEGEE